MHQSLTELLIERLQTLQRTSPMFNTQRKIALGAGVAQATIQRIVSGNQIPTLEAIEKLARVFNVSSPAHLLCEDDEMALLQAWAKLGDPEKKRVMRYILMTAQEMEETLSIEDVTPVPASLRGPQKAAAARPGSPEIKLQKDEQKKQAGRGSGS